MVPYVSGVRNAVGAKGAVTHSSRPGPHTDLYHKPPLRMTALSFSRRAFLFDLDGVLVDSEPVVTRTWRKWAERTGIVIPDLLARVQGRRSIDSIRDLAPHMDAVAESEWLARTERSDAEGLRLMSGALALFSSLGESERAIVTSCDRQLAVFRLRSVGIPIPAHLVTADDVREGKPSPEGYREGARRVGVDPTACVVVEDAPAGIRAGRAAGSVVVAVTTTFPLNALAEANVIVSSLEHLRARATTDGALDIDILQSLGGTGID